MAIRKQVIASTIAESDDGTVRLMMVWFDGGSTLYKVETDTDLHYDGINYIEAHTAFEKALPLSDSWNLD